MWWGIIIINSGELENCGGERGGRRDTKYMKERERESYRVHLREGGESVCVLERKSVRERKRRRQ